MSDNEPLLIEYPEPGIMLIRLNRPERRNALATFVLLSLAAWLQAAASDADVRAVVITGNATVFAAGADLNELAEADRDDPIESERFLAWRGIRAFPKPLMAAVEGWCLGAGAELMLCCDIVIAGATARIGQPETNLGIIPGAGGTATLTRLVGRAMAMQMVLTGEPIDAATALNAGLIAESTDEGDALARSLVIASQLAKRAPLAMQAAKASVRQASELAEGEHLLAERERFVALLGSADKREGIASFLERRAPRWIGA